MIVDGWTGGRSASALRCEFVDPRQNVPADPDAAWFTGDRGRPEPEWERERWAAAVEPDQYDPERYRSTDSHPLADSPMEASGPDTYPRTGRDEPLLPLPPAGERQPYGQPLHAQPVGAHPSDTTSFGSASAYGSAPYGTPAQRTVERHGDGTGEMAPEQPSRHYAAPLDIGALRRGPVAPVSGTPSGDGTDDGGGAGPVATGSVPAGGYGGTGGATAAPVASEPRKRAAEPGGSVYRSRRSGVVGALLVVTVIFELPALRAFLGSALADPMVIGDIVTSIFLIIALPMLAMGVYGLVTGAAGTPGQGPRVWLRTPLVYLPVALALVLATALAAR